MKLVLSSWAPPIGPRCYVPKRPEGLPSAAMIMDSTNAMHLLTSYATAGIIGVALFTMTYSKGLPLPTLVETDLSLQHVNALAYELGRLLTPGDIEPFHLLLGISSTPSLQIASREICPPWPKSMPAVILPSGNVIFSEPKFGGRAPLLFRLAVLVGTDGLVKDVRIIQSSRNVIWDQAAVAAVKEVDWYPGIVDHVAVEAWAEWRM